jgi:enterochelin esterase-like enzyme
MASITVNDWITIEPCSFQSEYLNRLVQFDVYLPIHVNSSEPFSLLLINDGQDLQKIQFNHLIAKLYSVQQIDPIVCVGIHCGVNRKMEYGTAYSADYLGRGAHAGLYTKFILDELIPFLRKKTAIHSFKDKSFAGFSLGGLSALDIVWNHASEFRKIGIFSASLWWRRKSYEDGYDEENDRLMHLQIRKGKFYPWLQFFIQCGALDEKADRNNNGIIDAIDDSLDLIVALKAIGYTNDHIHYMELADGKHDIATWARILPDFLQWGWGESKK